MKAISTNLLDAGKVAELGLCPICKINYITEDETVCSTCYEETDLSDEEISEIYGEKHSDRDDDDEEDTSDDTTDDDDLTPVDDDDLELLNVAGISDDDSLDDDDVSDDLGDPLDDLDDDDELKAELAFDDEEDDSIDDDDGFDDDNDAPAKEKAKPARKPRAKK